MTVKIELFSPPVCTKNLISRSWTQSNPICL